VTSYPLLTSGLTLGPLRLRNRVVMTAMTTGFGYEDGAPTAEFAAYLRVRSTDIAMTTVGFGAVRPEGRVETQIPWMWRDDIAARLAPAVDAIQAGGALASLQIAHGGRQVSPDVTGMAPVGPSPIPPLVHVRTPPHELTIGEIEAIVESFGTAAAKAAAAGFDAVEIHAGHGYLIQEFLSADANRRTDRYGGPTVAERARFGIEVVRAVRTMAPDIAVLVRINGTDLYPAGIGPVEAAEAAALLDSAGADGLLVSAGVYGTVPYTIPLLDDEEAPNLSVAAHVRAHVEIPVIAVAGVARPAVAEAALRRGECDAVALGRALLADPRWLDKAQRGEPERIRPCVATIDACAGMLARGERISCTVNPEVGREGRDPLLEAQAPGRVVVVGLGPAGLEAACRAAELGHTVVALERDARLGGAAALAAHTPPLARYGRLLAWFARRLETAGAEVRTEVNADGRLIAELDPNLVVVATGAVTEPPVLDGYDVLPAWPVEDLLAGRPSSTGTIASPLMPVVVGDGRIALATVLALTTRGTECTLLSRGRPGSDASGLARRAYLARLERGGVTLLRGHAIRLDAAGVWWSADGDDEHLAPADGLVLADRRRPERPSHMEALHAEVVRVGDARGPRDMTSAIAEGREAVEAFTRAGAARSGHGSRERIGP
jgi:2,4-dienoyl-CoA reductase-like NADH-dependent reductase (Old Yellow Enzyme family)/thioredoxin reductase